MHSLPDLATCKKIGFIVPSSNIAVETITIAIFQSLKDANIIPIFTRIRVKTVGTDVSSTSQFSTETMIAAAELLADAGADTILWNGTSGMWMGTGLEADQALAKAMHNATGVPCSTTTLATVAALEQLKVKRIGIAVPYKQDLAEVVRDFFATTGHGWEISALTAQVPAPDSNIEIAKSNPSQIEELIVKAGNGAEAVIVACTNWPGAVTTESAERKMAGPVVVDSIVVTVWQGLRMVEYESAVDGWGRMFREL